MLSFENFMKIQRFLRKEKPIAFVAKSAKSHGKGKVSNDRGAVNDVEDVDHSVIKTDFLAADGDADSSQEWWTKRFPDVPDDYQPDNEFLALIKGSEAALAYYAILPHRSALKAHSAKQSLQHVTLPEALLLLKLLKTELPLGFSRFVLTPYLAKQDEVLRARLSLTPHRALKTTWNLAFHLKHLKALIHFQGQRVGRFQYEHYQGALEKIEGEFEGQKMLLDPVWQQGKMAYERLHLADFESDLIRQKRQVKTGQIREQGQVNWALEVRSLASRRLDARSFITRKVWKLGPYHVQTRLLFVKSLLFPFLMHCSVYREQSLSSAVEFPPQRLHISFLEDR